MAIDMIIWCNVIIILCIAILGFFIGFTRNSDAVDGFVAGFSAGLIAFCFSLTGWIIYVVVHFISKYW